MPSRALLGRHARSGNQPSPSITESSQLTTGRHFLSVRVVRRPGPPERSPLHAASLCGIKKQTRVHSEPEVIQNTGIESGKSLVKR
jgi:hypothetical protein